MSAAKWDVIRAELGDTLSSSYYARPSVRCRFCGSKTRALSGVCTAHSDLPGLDPYTNVQAGRFSRESV